MTSSRHMHRWVATASLAERDTSCMQSADHRRRRGESRCLQSMPSSKEQPNEHQSVLADFAARASAGTTRADQKVLSRFMNRRLRLDVRRAGDDGGGGVVYLDTAATHAHLSRRACSSCSIIAELALVWVISSAVKSDWRHGGHRAVHRLLRTERRDALRDLSDLQLAEHWWSVHRHGRDVRHHQHLWIRDEEGPDQASAAICSWGLIGLILASIVNMFFASSVLYWVITYAGIFIFIGLTAYDTQRLKEMAYHFEGKRSDVGPDVHRGIADPVHGFHQPVPLHAAGCWETDEDKPEARNRNDESMTKPE